MNDRELKELHNKILEIAEYFDTYCKQHGIVYYLMGGSALGAMRHAGFIPWDDDFDVFMDFANYTKLLDSVKNDLDTDKFYFQHEDTDEWPMFFSKLRMNGTTYIERSLIHRDIHHGIYIDIMCLNHTSESTVMRYLQYLAARALSANGLAKNGYQTDSLVKSCLVMAAKFLIRGFVKSALLTFVRRLNKKSTGVVGHFFGRAPFEKTSFAEYFLGKQRYVDFDYLKLPVPEYAEKYLEVRYGKRYMELPSEQEKQLYPSHAYIVDTGHSYETYLAQNRSF